jgi:hypothetical protein
MACTARYVKPTVIKSNKTIFYMPKKRGADLMLQSRRSRERIVGKAKKIPGQKWK